LALEWRCGRIENNSESGGLRSSFFGVQGYEILSKNNDFRRSKMRYIVRFSLKRIREMEKKNPKGFSQMIREAQLIGGSDEH
jgi:uncharacterized protein YllA (UPF0747 family)